MNNEQVMTILLIIGVVMGLFANFLISNIKVNWAKVVAVYENNKKYKKLQENVDAMRARGELHEWREIMTPQGNVLVCEKTGWCPSLKGFIPVQMIQMHLEQLKAEEEYKEFRSARIQLIAHENNLTVTQTERMVEQIFTMKKDFYLQRISKLQQDLEAKAAAVSNEQGKD